MYTKTEIRSGGMLETIKKRKRDIKTRVRREKMNESSESQKRRNEIRQRFKLERELAANFKNGDYFVTLNFADECGLEEFKKRTAKLMRRLRAMHGRQFAYICVPEKGPISGKYHLHIVLPKDITSEMLVEAWEWGSVNIKVIYSAPHFKQLSEYLLKKNTPEGMKAWTCGRANKKPVEKTQKIRRKNFRKVPAEELRVAGKLYRREDWIEYEDPFTMEVVQHAWYFLAEGEKKDGKIHNPIHEPWKRNRKKRRMQP